MKITELFDSKYNYHWTSQNPEFWEGGFTTSEGDTINVELAEIDGVWDIVFDRNKSVDDTGGGDQYKIFSTVIAMVKDLNDTLKPKGFSFIGYKNDDAEARDSRISLYRMLTKAFEKDFKVHESNRDHRVHFYLIRKIYENATAGATGAGSIATSVGGLGAGFDDDYSKSIYGKQPKRKKPKIIKRSM